MRRQLLSIAASLMMAGCSPGPDTPGEARDNDNRAIEHRAHDELRRAWNQVQESDSVADLQNFVSLYLPRYREAPEVQEAVGRIKKMYTRNEGRIVLQVEYLGLGPNGHVLNYDGAALITDDGTEWRLRVMPEAFYEDELGTRQLSLLLLPQEVDRYVVVGIRKSLDDVRREFQASGGTGPFYESAPESMQFVDVYYVFPDSDEADDNR